MIQAATFILLGLVMGAATLALGGWYWLLAWPGVSFGLVGIAYFGFGPGLFGKRPDGRMTWWRIVLLLPFLIVLHAVWHAARLVSREPACHEVTPGLWLGRRLLPKEMPDQITAVVDLTCEFAEARAIVARGKYMCLPTLDGAAPDRDDLTSLLEHLRDMNGVIYIHCASGHGRSALVAAALLLLRGQAGSAADALSRVRNVRPSVRLQPNQYRMLESIEN